ncbi:hypothetical protein BDR07DRAFT_451601 [Suillus spraguei]|nr:hypothetical protein BDR07DRAFT_451601 [Suillus spraguei]
MTFPRLEDSKFSKFDGSINLGDSDKTVLKLAALLMATIFGGIHCMAWIFAFATYQERVLWRVSAGRYNFLRSGFVFFWISLTIQYRELWCLYIFSIVIISVMLYIAARAILLIIMFTHFTRSSF